LSRRSSTVAASNSLEPIHILGLGNLGKLFAHSLARYNPTTLITLLLHRRELVAEWEKAGQCIEVVTHGVSDKRGGFGIDVVFEPWGQEKSVIKHLIVATKTYATLAALTPLKHHLTEESTVFFLQNGMGTLLFFFVHAFRRRIKRILILHAIYRHYRRSDDQSL
jgi:2-dehydropantoate 2-reductase